MAQRSGKVSALHAAGPGSNRTVNLSFFNIFLVEHLPIFTFLFYNYHWGKKRKEKRMLTKFCCTKGMGGVFGGPSGLIGL